MGALIEGMWLIFWLGLFGGTALLAFSARRPWNLSLLVSLAANAVWSLFGDAVVHLLTPPASTAQALPETLERGGNAASALLAMEHIGPSASDVVGAALAMWLSLSFFMAVLSLRRTWLRPNNSSKPTPLRSAA